MYCEYVFTNVFVYMDRSEPHSPAKQISELLCRNSLNRQLLDMIFWHNQSNWVTKVGNPPKPQPEAMAAKITFLFWRGGWSSLTFLTRALIKIWPCHCNDLNSHLHSDEWLQVFYIFYILQFHPKYCLSCQFPLEKQSDKNSCLNCHCTKPEDITKHQAKEKVVQIKPNWSFLHWKYFHILWQKFDFWPLCGKTVTNSPSYILF